VIPKVVTPHVSRAAIGNVIALKHALEIVPKLASCLETTASQLSTSSSLLTSIIHTLKQPVFEAIHYDINEVINERVQLCRSVAQKRIQECFAIRAGMDGMLDVARRTYLETIDKIHQVVHKYKESIETIPIKLQYT
jgi:DNA mismatch repair protein MSH4